MLPLLCFVLTRDPEILKGQTSRYALLLQSSLLYFFPRKNISHMDGRGTVLQNLGILAEGFGDAATVTGEKLAGSGFDFEGPVAIANS